MWDYLQKSAKPIVLYGTGDAAEMIIDELKRRDIKVSGIFASNGFVRSRTFRGFPVKSYDDLKGELGEMIVLLSFGTHLPEVMENVKKIGFEQELYAPDLPIAGTELFTKQYAKLHEEDISWIREKLADDQSKLVLDEVIAYKCDGKPDHLFKCETPDSETWNLLDIGENESFLDLGAYNGDTVASFYKACHGKFSNIYAVEPDPRNFRKLTENTEKLLNADVMNNPNVFLYHMAVSDHEGEMPFVKNSGRGSANSRRRVNGQGENLVASLNDNPAKIQMITMNTVDGIIKGQPVSIIKFDLEGQEPLALKGAEETIKTQKPKMLLSAYHRIDDLWALPKTVLKYNPDYKLYLRHSPCIPAWEINYIVK